MPSWWWPGKRWSRSRTKQQSAPRAAASAACSPRHSHDHPAAAFVFAWAAASPSPVPRGGEKEKPPRGSLDSPAARRGTSSSTPCCGHVVAVAGQGFPLPRPKSGPLLPSAQSSQAEGCACASPWTTSVSGSGGSSPESAADDAVEDQRNNRYTDYPIVCPGARTVPADAHEHEQATEHKYFVSCGEHHRFLDLSITNGTEVNSQSFGALPSGAHSRGRKSHEETRGVRTRSLSPRPRGASTRAFDSSYAGPGDIAFGPWSTVRRIDDLKSRSQPLPLPPFPITGFLVPSSPIPSAQSQSQWKKGKLLGSGTFGQVYLGFNRK
ncbi:hypothetical protein PR202_gb08785 [Eleusine coracana subsp. coracana]|uniref:Uncharacterized protein n=1 Tax=Eleusine coracana subsp. coracana TaxID=191504 RepID=A0AAV5EFI6_ELECO|nr:hypothetical protein QOZ80_2BG0189500 [Eleusine coracana subsp. coracana]GJN21319.1 hypothetical protein PR202_gb08785 [Eleusine coracana subsp. coracana]